MPGDIRWSERNLYASVPSGSCSIALARPGLQGFTVGDDDAAARVPDQARALEHRGGSGDPGAAHAEQLLDPCIVRQGQRNQKPVSLYTVRASRATGKARLNIDKLVRHGCDSSASDALLIQGKGFRY